MKASTFFGILLGTVAIFGSFLWEGGLIESLFMLPAMVIVFGGTIAAGMAGTSIQQMLKLPRLIIISINPPVYNKEEIVETIVFLSGIARKEGILSVEKYLDDLKHPFLKKLFQICIDGADPDTLQKMVESEINYITERHNSNISLFVKLGGYSPTMGIIGTVMGLIATLSTADKGSPAELIKHIAMAFIATMWGIFMANIVWLPIGDKLKTLHNEEMQLFQLMLDGVYAVQLGENPSVIKSRLVAAFPLSQQESILQKGK